MNRKIILSNNDTIDIESIETIKNIIIRIKIKEENIEKLKTTFSNKNNIKKITILENNNEIATYENYTELDRIAEYNDGTIGIDMIQPRKIIKDEKDKEKRLNDIICELNKRAETAFLEAKVAELIVKMQDLKPTSN